MKGFVPTSDALVNRMVAKLFADGPPRSGSRLLDPGCGPGAFIAGVLRWCADRGVEPPEIVGVEMSPERAACARERFVGESAVTILEEDFLAGHQEPAFDYVIGNPPYVSITGLDEDEKARYRSRYESAGGRFDLYMLFVEEALGRLRMGGRLVFITPEKFLYVESARALRRVLARVHVREVELVPEDAFAGLVTYPMITSITKEPPAGATRCVTRDRREGSIRWTIEGAPLLAQLNGREATPPAAVTLRDVCVRISAGVATGADEVFVRRREDLAAELKPFAHPTISGRQLVGVEVPASPSDVLLMPYDPEGHLLDEAHLGALGALLYESTTRVRLSQRTCSTRKPWYAFHETPPLSEMLRPKILCKDIAPSPRFWLDPTGRVVPRHSVYYLVPQHPDALTPLLDYLSGPEARDWLEANCQRAANGFIRLQSRVIQQLPLPKVFGDYAEHPRLLAEPAAPNWSEAAPIVPWPARFERVAASG